MLSQKQLEFNAAIHQYHTNQLYPWIGRMTSVTVILLQLGLIYGLYIDMPENPTTHALSYSLIFVLAYFLTDFVNGCIHMLMDNTTHYTSCVGPLIAAFHLHHKTPKYKNRSALCVYFNESGAKTWLPFYLLVLALLRMLNMLIFKYELFFVFVGILSSFAEVSHYWCHNARPEQWGIKRLQRMNILLNPKHHRIHHIQDNTHYAFLNGSTDHILNKIAQYFFKGYKNHADLHVLAYRGIQTGNRNYAASN